MLEVVNDLGTVNQLKFYKQPVGYWDSWILMFNGLLDLINSTQPQTDLEVYQVHLMVKEVNMNMEGQTMFCCWLYYFRAYSSLTKLGREGPSHRVQSHSVIIASQVKGRSFEILKLGYLNIILFEFLNAHRSVQLIPYERQTVTLKGFYGLFNIKRFIAGVLPQAIFTLFITRYATMAILSGPIILSNEVN